MCGLFGMAGVGVNSDDLDVINDLMIVSALRGTDATGLAAGATYGKAKCFKIKGDPYYWRWDAVEKGFEKSLFNISNSYFLGHCRKRTTGATDVNGAQPFTGDKVIGTHNGMLSWDFDKFHTDSAKLIALINANTDDFQSVIDQTNANDAIALVWFNSKTGTLNLYKNNKRPLFFAFNEKRSVLYWASELEMLTLALKRNRVEFDAYFCQDNNHYSIKIGDINPKDKIEKLSAVVIKQPEPVTAKVIHIGGKGKHPKDNSTVQGETLEELKQIPWMRDNIAPSTPWEGPNSFDEYDEEVRERLLH